MKRAVSLTKNVGVLLGIAALAVLTTGCTTNNYYQGARERNQPVPRKVTGGGKVVNNINNVNHASATEQEKKSHRPCQNSGKTYTYRPIESYSREKYIVSSHILP